MRATIAKPIFQPEVRPNRSKEKIGTTFREGAPIIRGRKDSDSNQLESVASNAKNNEPKRNIKKSPWSKELDLVVSNFPKLDKNLDGYVGFEGLSPTIKKAKAFLNKLYRSDIGTPHIAPHDEDTILLEWYFPCFEIIVYINSAGEFEYCLATLGKNEQYEYEDFESESEKNCLTALNKWFAMILDKQP